VTIRLHDVVKVCMCGITDGLALPEAECIHEPANPLVEHELIGCQGVQKIRIALDDGISSAISVLVPAVRGADSEHIVEGRLGVLHYRGELRPREVATVQSLRPDRDGVHLIFVLRGILRNDGQVRRVALVGVRPWKELVSSPIE
jgi:hypothetical protein